MRLPTASELPRVMACPASAILPRANSTGKAADRGTAIHAFLHAVRRAGRAIALKETPEEYRVFCESIDLSVLPVGGEPEISYGWDYVTGAGRRLGTARDYAKALPHEFVGTADLVDVVKRTFKCDDYKSGFRFVPPDSWQMKALCLFGARAEGCDDAESTIWKIGDDGVPRPYLIKFDGFELDTFADDLERLAKRLATMKVDAAADVTEGDHCCYCKAFMQCPAKVTLVKTLAKTEELTLDDAGRAYSEIQRYRGVLDAMESRILEMAAQSPIALPNGHVLKEVESTRESINSEIAYSVITRDFGHEAAMRAVEQKATKASIKRALNGGTKKALQAIDAEGGINVRTTASVKEVDR